MAVWLVRLAAEVGRAVGGVPTVTRFRRALTCTRVPQSRRQVLLRRSLPEPVRFGVMLSEVALRAEGVRSCGDVGAVAAPGRGGGMRMESEPPAVYRE